MNINLKKAADALFTANGQTITNIYTDAECVAYSGYNFRVGNANIKFRNAKRTPKKIGQFVALWKRNNQGQTVPFHIDDDFDFYIIATETTNRSGFFLFPKRVLCDKHILTGQVEGKRGFRVYPDWDSPENKQAKRTQEWQSAYFINLSHAEESDAEQLRTILNS